MSEALDFYPRWLIQIRRRRRANDFELPASLCRVGVRVLESLVRVLSRRKIVFRGVILNCVVAS